MSTLDAEWLRREVDGASEFYVLLGVFTHKFGAVDMQLTRLHAHLCEAKDFEIFADEVSRKTTAGKRVSKIASLANARRPMGPKFAQRLSSYGRDVVELRNRLVHDEIIPEGEHVRLIAIDRYDVGVREEVRPTQRPEIIISLREIVAVARWLDAFHADVCLAAETIWDPDGHLEVEDPAAAPEAPFRIRWDP